MSNADSIKAKLKKLAIEDGKPFDYLLMHYLIERLLDMERPQLKAYSLESVIAEKFQAMIYLAESNSRMKDFYDIYKLCHSFDFNGRTLYEAVSQTIERRATPLTRIPTVFSAAFPLLKDKQAQWHAFQRRIGVVGGVDFIDVITDVKSFLLPPYNCILSGNEFFGRWNHTASEWVSTENR